MLWNGGWAGVECILSFAVLFCFITWFYTIVMVFQITASVLYSSLTPFTVLFLYCMHLLQLRLLAVMTFFSIKLFKKPFVVIQWAFQVFREWCFEWGYTSCLHLRVEPPLVEVEKAFSDPPLMVVPNSYGVYWSTISGGWKLLSSHLQCWWF